MASVCAITITPSPGGLQLTINDIGTYSLPIISKVLTVYDATGALLQTFNMGAATSQTYDPAGDAYFAFQLNVVDQTGVVPTGFKNFLSEGVVIAAFLNRMVATGCSCAPQKLWNLIKARLNIFGAERFALSAFGIAADTLITRANTYINAYLN